LQSSETLGADYVERARQLGPMIEAAGDEIERRRDLPELIVAALAERGLFRLLLPRSVGGAELPPTAYVPVVEEVAKHDASVAWCLGQACGCSMTAAYLAPEAAREIFGGERGIVAWGPPGPAEARMALGGYRLTGTWSFASGSHHATWLGAHVAVFAEDGTPRLRPDGSPVFRTLLFPKRQAAMTDIWRVMGLRGTGSDSYTVTDLFVPEAFSTTREDPTLRRERGPLYAFTMQCLYATGVAAAASGMARAMRVLAKSSITPAPSRRRYLQAFQDGESVGRLAVESNRWRLSHDPDQVQNSPRIGVMSEVVQ